tara:strand:+ start:431 stop:1558 length:1128 start_codon:yes stop_codon:yes gene_type:complete
MYIKKIIHSLSLAACISLAISFSSCSGDVKGNGAPTTLATYPVSTLKYQQVTTNKSYPATIEGIQTVELRPRIEGYLDQIYVDEGATVKKGETLFKINANEYAQAVSQAKANVAAAEAQVNTATVEVEKQKPLVAKGIVGEYVLKSAEYAQKSAEASLMQAQAALESAQTNLSYTLLKSPTDGIIGTIPYRIGSLVNNNIAEPLTTISDIRQVRAYFGVNEKEYLYLSKNLFGKNHQEMDVELILADGSTFPQTGHIDAISGIIDQSTGAVTIRATFENPDRILRSGGSAKVKLPNKLDSVLVVPQAATYEIQNKRFIYVVSDENKVASREITVIADDKGKNFIVTGGLTPGETVVVDGINSLKTDMQISPQEVL